MSHPLTVYGAVPNALELINAMGSAIARSRLLGCENEDQGRVLAMTCLAKGSDPLSLAQRYDIIQGKLSKKSDAMLAEFRSVLGGRHKIIERSADAAEIELTLEGSTQRFRFTWEEAQSEPFTKDKNGQTKTNYATPRTRMQMLWARVVSDGVRAMAPEVNCGIYTPEEIQDIESDGGTPPAAKKEQGRPSSPVDSSVIEADFTVFNDLASGEQIKRIRELFLAMNVPADKQLAAFKKRGADSMASLTTNGATDLIRSLESLLAKAQDAMAGQSQADPEAIEEPSDGPASTAQVNKAKSLLAQLVKQPGHAESAKLLKAKLVESGLSAIADLTRSQCDELIQSLVAENLKTFFDSSLAGSPAPGE